MLVKVAMTLLKNTFSGTAVCIGSTIYYKLDLHSKAQPLPIPLVVISNCGEKGPIPALFHAAIVNVYLPQDVSPVISLLPIGNAAVEGVPPSGV